MLLSPSQGILANTVNDWQLSKTEKKEGFFLFWYHKLTPLDCKFCSVAFFLSQTNRDNALVVYVICMQIKSQRIVNYTVSLLLRFKNFFTHLFYQVFISCV